MASCILGAPNVKLPKLDFGRVGIGNLQQLNGTRTWIGRGKVQYARLAVSHEAKKAFRICCSASVEAKIVDEAVAHTADDSKETKLSGSRSKFIPNSSQVQSLVSDICDTTSIAEFELKLDGFRLYVKRKSAEGSIPPAQTFSAQSVSAPAPSPSPPAPASTPGGLNGSASTSLAITKPVPTSGGIQSLLARAADEGLVILPSPRVGFFRRSRTIKGNRAPPPCEEKQLVKEGQAVCFVEQLGGELPIKTDVAGEVIKILKEDGEPVGYGDALIAILPSFPGIKKLQ